jgi:hypothetical protein
MEDLNSSVKEMKMTRDNQIQTQSMYRSVLYNL